MTSSQRIMGSAFVNSKAIKTVAWTIAAMIIAVNGWLTYVFAAENLSESPLSIAALCVGVALYLLFVSYLIVGPEWAEAIAGSMGCGSLGAGAKLDGGYGARETDAEPLLEAGESASGSRVQLFEA